MAVPRPLRAAVPLLVVLFAACGPSEEPAAGPSEPATGSTEAAEPATEAAQASESAPEDASEASEPATEASEASAAASAPASEDAAAAGSSADGVLRFGYVLPQTGPLVAIGPPQINAFELAIEDVNAAGGVLGAPVEAEAGDEGGEPGVAEQSVDRLLAADVDAIIGAASSAVSLTVIDRITGEGVLQCSGSNTSRTFTDYEDNGFYSRAVPTNLLQAPVFADTIVADGATRVAMLVRADDYGESLGDAIETSLTEVGAEVTEKVLYDPNAVSFDVEVQQALASNPDAVVVVAFDEGVRVLQTMIEQGGGPGELSVYVTDGMGFADLAERASPDDPGAVASMKGVATSAEYDQDFLERLRAANPGLETVAFAPYVYDCVVTIALAAEAAGTDDPAAVRDELVGVTRDGEQCTSFEACRDLLAQGTDIDYDGVSGPLEYVEAAEPSTGVYDVVEFGPDGAPEIVDTVTIES